MNERTLGTAVAAHRRLVVERSCVFFCAVTNIGGVADGVFSREGDREATPGRPVRRGGEQLR